MNTSPVTHWKLAVAAASPWFVCVECFRRIPFGNVVATTTDRDDYWRCLSCVTDRVLRSTLEQRFAQQQDDAA